MAAGRLHRSLRKVVQNCNRWFSGVLIAVEPMEAKQASHIYRPCIFIRRAWVAQQLGTCCAHLICHAVMIQALANREPDLHGVESEPSIRIKCLKIHVNKMAWCVHSAAKHVLAAGIAHGQPHGHAAAHG